MFLTLIPPFSCYCYFLKIYWNKMEQACKVLNLQPKDELNN
tara:strand:- start:646 stop:768 length:123 start_codon:yes stop_codon:yes gene_type:complete